MKRFKVIVLLVLVGLALIVVQQNTEAVDTRLIFVTVSMPRAVLLGIALLVGFVCGILATLAVERQHDEREQNRRRRKDCRDERSGIELAG